MNNSRTIYKQMISKYESKVSLIKDMRLNSEQNDLILKSLS